MNSALIVRFYIAYGTLFPFLLFEISLNFILIQSLFIIDNNSIFTNEYLIFLFIRSPYAFLLQNSLFHCEFRFSFISYKQKLQL